MLKLKAVLLLALSLGTQSAMAYVACAGETYGGVIVEVSINTVGAMGYPKSGAVRTEDVKTGERKAYTLNAEEIVQFFENADGQRAIVGLGAYAELNNPIWIKYVGKNYEGDLLEILRDSNRIKQQGNEMRVWKGPGYGPSEQYQFMDVVCSVTIDP